MAQRKSVEFTPIKDDKKEIIKRPVSDIVKADVNKKAAIDPIAVVNIIDKAIDLVNNLGNCIQSMYNKRQETLQMKERTKQIEAMAQARITEEKEATKRFYIEQVNETARLKIQAQKEIETMKLQLEKYKMDLQMESYKLQERNFVFSEKINELKNYSRLLMKTYSNYENIIMKAYDEGEVPEESAVKTFNQIRLELLHMIDVISEL